MNIDPFPENISFVLEFIVSEEIVLFNFCCLIIYLLSIRQ